MTGSIFARVERQPDGGDEELLLGTEEVRDQLLVNTVKGVKTLIRGS
jgi:hypothetical protein